MASQYTDNHVQLVADSTFSQVVRLRFPYATTDHWYIQGPKTLGSSYSKLWYRATLKWGGDYTTMGEAVAGGANSHKHLFMTWAGGVGNRLEWEFSNTAAYVLGMGQTGRTFVESGFTNSTWTSGEPSTSEWTDGEWWEYILNYDTRIAGSNGTAIYRLFRRQLTSAGSIVNNVFDYNGQWCSYTGGTAPALAASVNVLANRNKSTSSMPDGSARTHTNPMYIYIGPWETVNGDVDNDPYGLQGTGE